MDVMIGCASFEGADPRQLAILLSFLHHHARATHAWCAKALPDRSASMDLLPKQMINPKEALRALRPLIKGLRLREPGDAVIDRQFGTTDVLVILPVSTISQLTSITSGQRRADPPLNPVCLSRARPRSRHPMLG